ncbi:Chemotaxis protein [Azospirillaceae bacterium]
MHESMDLVWWISAVEIPVMGGLFWMITRQSRDSEEAIDELRQRVETTRSQEREALASYKLEVAKSYASVLALKEVETRLTDHLLRIESKLDCGMIGYPMEGLNR